MFWGAATFDQLRQLEVYDRLGRHGQAPAMPLCTLVTQDSELMCNSRPDHCGGWMDGEGIDRRMGWDRPVGIRGAQA